MTSQPIEANVVLSADNSQYDMAMDQSAQSTDKLGKSIDTLGQKINNLSKSAGRKLLGITAADVAVITGATAAWASYEKQISRLQAQAAITTRSRDQEIKVMKTYTDSVKNLRNEFGTTTSEAAALTQQISKLADQSRSIKDLGTVFEQMSKATGESSTGLANSLLNLQKIMGTPQTDTRKYADQLTYLAAKSNTTATALADFTSQIAPMGRAMGMSQTQVTGFANMFVKAGQDGYSAATAFSKVAQDITQAVQTGSPDLHKYANILGVTVQQFKGLSGAEQVAGFLDQIAKLGPRAAQELNRFGFDGIRMSRAITATVQSSGGAMNAIQEAQIGYGSDATQKGAEAAHTMSDTLARLRQDLQQTAEAFGKAFGPGVDLVLRQVERLASGFENLMEGPLGKFIQFAAAVVVPVTAAAGALALMAGTILKVGAAMTFLRGSPGLGFIEGLRGGSRIVPELSPAGLRTGRFVAAGEPGRDYLGTRGAQIAEGGTFLQRGLYNTGQMFGTGARGGWGFLNSLGAGPPGTPNIWSRGTQGVIRLGGDALRSQLDALRFANPAQRSQWFGQYFPGMGPQVETAMRRTDEARQGVSTAQAVHTSVMGAQGATEDQKKAAVADLEAAKKHAEAMEKDEKIVLAGAAARVKEEAEVVRNTTVFATMRAEGASFTRALIGATGGLIKLTASTAVSAGKGLMNMLGGPLNAGLFGATMLLPLAIPLIQKLLPKKEEAADFSNFGAAYGAPTTGTSAIYRAARGVPQTVAAATRISPVAVAAATSPDYKLNESAMEGLTEDQATTLIGTRWTQIQNNPEALGKVRDDLINQFGPDGAQRILGSLQGGKFSRGFGSTFAQIRAGTDVSTNVGLVGAIAASRFTTAAQTGGPNAQFRQQAQDISTIYRQAALQRGTGGGEEIIKQLKAYGIDLGIDQIPLTRAQEGQMGYTGGQVRAMEQAGVITTAEQVAAMTPADRLAYLIENAPEDQGDKLRALFNVPAGATGDDLTSFINKTLGAKGEPLSQTGGTLQSRVRQQGPAGRMFEGSQAIQTALGFNAQNVGANVKAINDMLDKMKGAGMSAPEITKAMGKIQSTFGDPTDPNYILAGMISGQAQQELALRLPNMTRAQGFGAQVNMFQAVSSIKPVTDEQYQAQQDAKAQMAQAMTDQENYFKQMLLMQDQYEVQRRRAQEDYSLQRGYQEHDYQLSRTRAEEAFNRSRNRATADYYRGVRRAEYDFELQRTRARDDFQHSITLQAREMATSAYDVYQRVPAQRTASASWTLANARDQLRMLREQEKNLQELRKLGFSDAVIQQLRLTDPQNAQQLARFVTEVRDDPSIVGQYNRVARGRQRAARDLGTDESNAQWQEMRRNFRLQMSRSAEDFERQMRRGREDFNRGLDRQRQDFNISMDQQAQDFDTQMGRQADAYQKSMERSAEDLANVGKEIDLNFEQVLTQSVNKLTGHAQKQAQAVLKSFRDLKNNSVPEAVDLMQSLADIFGFKYQIPKGYGHYMTQQQAPEANPGDVRHPGVQVGPTFNGGVIPGWTPGRDTVMQPVSGGEAIMRPEWARAVGEKNIDAMNHQARYGGFFLGGVIPLPNASVSQHTTGYPWAAWAGDLNYPGYADYGKPIHAWRAGIARPFDYGRDYSYGRGQVIDSGSQSALYAHMSRVLTGLAGKRVNAGDVIGYVGDYGNTGTPPTSHLHFEIRGGQINLGDIATGGGQHQQTARLASIMRQLYPRSERAAREMQGVHPLFPGDISSVMNRYLRRAYQRLAGRYGRPTGPNNLGDAGLPAAPDDVHGAVAIGKEMAANMGWTGNEWNALYQLWQHESGWRWNADNPTSSAYGIPQALPGSKMATAGADWQTNPRTQIEWGLNYIKNRPDYGRPSRAWALWQSRDPHWYGDGSVFTSPNVIGVGERGPEAVIPLNDRGGEFLTKAMLGTEARGIGMGGVPMRGGLSVHNYRIDKSTNFTGPITVQANDPTELLNKLQARQRVMALSRPALTGSAA